MKADFKKLIRITIIVLVCLFMFLSPLIMSLGANLIDDGYIIDNYYVEMYVNKNGNIDIEETIDVDFKENRHGIYLHYPTKYSMYFEDEYKEYRFPITNKKVLSNHDYEINDYGDSIEFKIGSPDYYAEENEIYKIGYTMVTNNLNFNDHSLFYQNLLYQSTTLINKFDFKIHFEDDIDQKTLAFYIGNDNDNEHLNYNYYESNNEFILEGTYNEVLLPHQSITIFTKLPKDYFVFPTYNHYYIILCGATCLLVILIIILFFRNGKDDEVIVTVEFTAPTGMSSAEVGYIADGVVDTRDVTSLILEWAKDGFLTITESNDDLVFDKIKDLPDEYSAFQKVLFNDLFLNRDSVSTSSLKYNFSDSIFNCKYNIRQYYSSNKRRLYYSNSILSQVLTKFVAILPVTLLILLAAMTQYYLKESAFYIIPIIILQLMTMTSLQGIQRSKDSKSKLRLSISFIFACITFCIQFFIASVLVRNLVEINIIYVYITEVATLILIFLSSVMDKRTPKGNRWYGQVLGLRNFILYTEKDRLDLLLKDNPQLFYNILPYAYAFGISDIWQEHFKDLTFDNPDWYRSTSGLSSYYLISRMNRNFSRMTSTISAPKPSQRSSGGFSGGGGGFSGGGFGGGSVGSW